MIATIILAIIAIAISIVTLMLLANKDSKPNKGGSDSNITSAEPTPEKTEEEESVDEPPIEKPTPQTSYPVKTMYVNCSDFLALKSGPGINYTRILKIPAGEAVDLLEYIEGDFVKVRYNGTEGYVAAAYLSETRP